MFSIQFEKRDGTLRDMTARIGVWKGPDGKKKNPQHVSDEMTYNPADYNLKIVFDTQKGEYRNIATDRVTLITIGGQTYQTASSQWTRDENNQDYSKLWNLQKSTLNMKLSGNIMVIPLDSFKLKINL